MKCSRCNSETGTTYDPLCFACRRTDEITAARIDELKRMRRKLKAVTRRTCADNVHAVIGDEIAAIDRRIKKLRGGMKDE